MEVNRKETLRPRRSKGHYLRLVGGAATLAVGMSVAAIYTVETPIDKYKNNFTDDGKCLDGTVYDEEKGADVTLETENGAQVVRVVPDAANTHTPAVLYITEIDKGWFGFGDHQTGIYLTEKNCENVPDGY